MFSRTAILAIFVFAVACSPAAQAQTSASQQSPRSSMNASDRDDSDFGGGNPILETRKKMEIRAAEAEHRELIERGDAIAQMSERLQKSFLQNKRLTVKDAEMLDDLEKTVKKVRKSLGGSNDEEIVEDQPKSPDDALERIIRLGAELKENLKKSSRLTISAETIADANEILDLIAFLRLSFR